MLCRPTPLFTPGGLRVQHGQHRASALGAVQSLRSVSVELNKHERRAGSGPQERWLSVPENTKVCDRIFV